MSHICRVSGKPGVWALPLLLAACTPIRPGHPGPPLGLHASCATASVVGLAWMPPGDRAAPAGYRISRDGTPIGTSSAPEFSDGAVSAAATYTYTVAALDALGDASPPGALTVNVAAASAHGDAPVCRDPAIESMTWDWAAALSEPDGSDLWPATWGADGHVYWFFGDGGGFGGSDTNGRTSFGIAMADGAAPLRAGTGGLPPQVPARTNVYGGLRSRHPSRIDGKAASIIAVGRNLYTLGGIYRPSDSIDRYPHRPSGSPDHLEIAYSIGNAYSWRDSPWDFCGRNIDTTGAEGLYGAFCPMSFINYGRGNAGAPGGFVYLLGAKNSTYFWAGGVAPLPVETYLARVPGDRILTHSAYRYFAGVDPRGEPVWSAGVEQMQPIFADRNGPQTGCGSVCNMAGAIGEAVYDAGLRRYIGIAQGDYLSQTAIYDAATPWGPWKSISYENIDAATGRGGWANLGTAAGASLGLHPVNAWTSRDGTSLWLTFSSNGKAPADSLFPPAGTDMDSFNLVHATLLLTRPPP